jgi:hypothetical protein
MNQQDEGKTTIVFNNTEDVISFVEALQDRWLESYWCNIRHEGNQVIVYGGWENITDLWEVICQGNVNASDNVLSYSYEKHT